MRRQALAHVPLQGLREVLACASVLAALLGWLSPLRYGDPQEATRPADESSGDHLVGAADGAPRAAESMDP